MSTFKDRDDWLNARGKRIGGSDAASVIGKNPWMSNVKLWRIKTWREKQEDISDLPVVKYGTEAEKYIRGIYTLDHPQYKVNYKPDNIWFNDLMPWAHASLDGWLDEKDSKRKGILEIKTSNIASGLMASKWKDFNGKDRLPDGYFCQCLHYLMVTEFDFVELIALLKDMRGEREFQYFKVYHIERSEVEEDIEYLRKAEEDFWRYVMEDREPNLILPEI